jgi:hypothetical protein
VVDAYWTILARHRVRIDDEAPWLFIKYKAQSVLNPCSTIQVRALEHKIADGSTWKGIESKLNAEGISKGTSLRSAGKS